MKQLAAVAIAFACSTSFASEITVGVHLYTQHFSPSEGYNNVTPGLYVVVDNWIGGSYYNSERRASVYGGYVFKQFGGSPFDLIVGAISGYSNRPITPLLVPSFAWKGWRITLIPPIPIEPKHNTGALHLSYEFSL